MKQKNVLLIMCDQLPAGVLEAYGGKIPTPNISRIATSGVRFQACYCQTPLCTPSRGTLITGLYPHESGLVSNVMRLDYPTVGGPETEEGILRSDRITEQVLCDEGYHTMHVGKWHLSGEQPACYPEMFREHQEFDPLMKERFDEVARLPRKDYVDWYGWKLPVDVRPSFAEVMKKGSALWPAGSPLEDFCCKIGRLDMKEEELYDWHVADRCAAALRKEGFDRPFMLTCSFNMPHDPNVAPSPYYEEADPDWLWDYVDLPCEDFYQTELSGELPRVVGKEFLREFARVYAAAVLFIDRQVGKVLDALEESGHAEDTIVIFTADHGDMTCSHGMYWKCTSAFYEEVARVPLLISVPGAEKGVSVDQPVGLIDLPATILELCHAPGIPESSGVSLVPFLYGQSVSHPPVLSERLDWEEGHRRFRRSGDKKASFMLRDGSWKYVLHLREGIPEEHLFNLEADPHEACNLAGRPENETDCIRLYARLKEELLKTGYTLYPSVLEERKAAI